MNVRSRVQRRFVKRTVATVTSKAPAKLGTKSRTSVQLPALPVALKSSR